MSFLGEIKRRKVFQVAAVYAVVAWLIMQVVDVVNEPLSLPDWFDTVVILLLAIGFPIAILLSWAFDITPEGVVRDEGTRPGSGKGINYALVALLVIASIWIGYRELISSGPERDNVLPNSVAVLPFENLSPDPDNAYFAAGIHESTLNQLAKIADLNVIARTSVLQYENDPPPIPEIADALRVEAVMEGSVRYANDRVLITAQLIDGDTGAHLWSEEFEEQLIDIFAIQARIAESIASELEATLLPQEVALLNEIPTQSTRAVEFYLSGNEYFRERDFLLAANMYQRAVDEDPQFALAYAGLSQAHADIYWFGLDPGIAHRELALDAVESAFELAPDLPEAYLARGNYYYHGTREYERALAELAIAEQRLPGHSDLHFSRGAIYRRMGRFDEALASFDRAAELDPRFIENLLDAAQTFAVLRNYDEALERMERLAAIAPDNNGIVRMINMIPLWRDGDEQPIVDAYESGRLEGNSSIARIMRGSEWRGYLYSGEHARALEYLDSLSEDWISRGRRDHFPKASAYGTIHRLMGNLELSRQYFQVALEQIDSELAVAEDLEVQMEAAIVRARGEILAGLGERDEALAMAARVTSLLPESVDPTNYIYYRLEAAMTILLPLGEYDAALAEIDAYLGGGLGRYTIEGLLPHPNLDPIRDDPRFAALVEKYGQP